MPKADVLNRLHEIGVIAIFRVNTPEECLRGMDALSDGGLTAFEVTTTTPDAVEVVSAARKKFGAGTLVGMGTVLDAPTAEAGIEAGAQFIVSPSLHKDVIDVCSRHGVVSCPGTFSATEVAQASKWGADLIKLFPISQVGPEYLEALRGPFPRVKFVPTGGVDAGNAADYIKAGAYCLGVGGGLVSKGAIAQGRYDLLTRAAREILNAVSEARQSVG
jgi:2-dehydro-3-deoxyphosphogluconate aldolase / (4S)-4-hydroxy-2-oxoglutarate aldolase